MTQRWGTYTRISEDPNDAQRGVTRQNADTADAVAALGGTVAKQYIENDTSAFKKRRIKVTDPEGREYFGWRVIRPHWHEALHDLRTGAINALMVWDLDRLARDPRDLEDAIETVEHYGARIVSQTASTVDLTNDVGIMAARINVAMANKSSRDTARRVAAAHLASAREGKPVGGRRPFGWNDDKRTIRETEAAAIRQAAEDVIAGVPIRRIVEAWNEAGIKTPASPKGKACGKEWDHVGVVQVLRSPRLAGWRTHRPSGAPWTPVAPIAVDRDGQPVHGQWEPIIDDATHRALVAKLATPDTRSRKPRRGARYYMLTGLLRCGVCGGMMYGNKVGDTYYYNCDSGKTKANGGHVNSASGRGTDAYVSQKIIEAADLVEPVTLAARTPTSDRIAELQQLIDDSNEMIEEVMAAFRAKTIGGSVAFKSVADLEVTRDEASKERDQLEAALAAQEKDEELDADTWQAMDVDRRRAVCERRLEAVYILPAKRRSSVFDTSRVELVWR